MSGALEVGPPPARTPGHAFKATSAAQALLRTPVRGVAEALEPLIDWPEDKAEAAAIVAECHRIRDLMKAMKATGQDRRHEPATMQMLTAVNQYLRVYPDGQRLLFDDSHVYSDGFRDFVLGLIPPIVSPPELLE